MSRKTNIVRTNGTRLGAAGKSRRAVMHRHSRSSPTSRRCCRRSRRGLPKALGIEPVVRSVRLFVSSAVSGVVREALIAAALTGLMMILLFSGELARPP